MRAPEIIQRKRDGLALSEAEIRFFLDGYTRGDIPDYQMAAMAMAIFFRDLDDDELAVWTDAMLRSGRTLAFPEAPGPCVDKHSTGGVGDKVSFVLAPIAAAAGLTVPMISGRGLGHTGGTLDKLESIPGLRVEHSPEDFQRLVLTHGLAMVGQSADLVPADRRLYALRDVTATVACIPLIAASIMSKKLAEGLQALVLDIKVGSGAFMSTPDQARALAARMIAIGERMGVRTRVLLTDMDQPLGWAVGNTLEIREALDTLQGGGPPDLRALCLELAAEMIHLGGLRPTLTLARELAAHTLDSGAAHARFLQVIAAQGGDLTRLLPPAPCALPLPSPAAGYIAGFDTTAVGLAAVRLGAGRTRAGDPIDHAVGLVLHKKRGDAVAQGEPLLTLYAHTPDALPLLRDDLLRAIHLQDTPPEAAPLVVDRLG